MLYILSCELLPTNLRQYNKVIRDVLTEGNYYYLTDDTVLQVTMANVSNAKNVAPYMSFKDSRGSLTAFLTEVAQIIEAFIIQTHKEKTRKCRRRETSASNKHSSRSWPFEWSILLYEYLVGYPGRNHQSP
mgnify:CR=1 FL=1